MILHLFKQKETTSFYKRVFILTLPIIIQNLIVQMLNMSDTLIVGRLGEKELASVGIANQYFFFFSLILFGINAGTSMFISQFWGKKDKLSITKTSSLGVFLSIIISVIFTIIAFLFSKEIIGIFNNDIDVLSLGSKYLLIVAISYIFTGISLSFSFSSRSIENTFLPMISSLIAFFVNLFLNYVLVFGKIGFPPMGVAGSAWATVIARILETCIILIYVYKKDLFIRFSPKVLFETKFSFLKPVLLGIIPILINEIVWGLGNVSYNIIYARLGVGAAATIQITTTIINLFMIIIFALGNSAMIIVGKEIGKGDISSGKKYANKIYKLALIIGTFIGFTIYILANKIVLFFNMSPEVLQASSIILKISAFILILRTYNFMMIVGILRGGGDAKFGVILQGIIMWFIGIPSVYVAAFILKLPIYYVVAFCITEEILKLIFISFRFKSGKWIKDLTKNIQKETIQTI